MERRNSELIVKHIDTANRSDDNVRVMYLRVSNEGAEEGTQEKGKLFETILAIPSDFALTITNFSQSYKMPEQSIKIIPKNIQFFERILAEFIKACVVKGTITVEQYIEFCKKRLEQYRYMQKRGGKYSYTRNMITDFYNYYFPLDRVKFTSFNLLEQYNKDTIIRGLNGELISEGKCDFYTDDKDRIRVIPKDTHKMIYNLDDKLIHALQLSYGLDGGLTYYSVEDVPKPIKVVDK